MIATDIANILSLISGTRPQPGSITEAGQSCERDSGGGGPDVATSALTTSVLYGRGFGACRDAERYSVAQDASGHDPGPHDDRNIGESGLNVTTSASARVTGRRCYESVDELPSGADELGA